MARKYLKISTLTYEIKKSLIMNVFETYIYFLEWEKSDHEV